MYWCIVHGVSMSIEWYQAMPTYYSQCLIYIIFNHTVAPMDYFTVNTILVFDKCENRRCVNVIVNNDMTLEQDESFSITVDLSTEHTTTINIDIVISKWEVLILDDDNQEFVCMTQFYNYIKRTTGY